MLIYDQCSQGQHMGCFTPPLRGSANQQNCIAPNATSRPRFPRLDSKINIKFSFMVIHIWLKI
jgi:hypothetical protein